MGIKVHVKTVTDNTIIALDGTVDTNLLIDLGDGLAAVAHGARGPVLIDITNLTFLDPARLDALVDRLLSVAHGRAGLIANGLAARQLLDRSGIANRIPIIDATPDGEQHR